MKLRTKIGLLSAAAIAAALGGYGAWRSGTLRAEVRQLVAVLAIQPGSSVADVGAGDGTMAIRIAERVGKTGRVFATELDPKKLATLRGLRSRDAELVVIQGSVADSALPAACCDAVYLRRVYHHFTEPGAMNASIFKALRPGGRLAVIDFEPHTLAHLREQPAGTPANRGGHGIPRAVLVAEVAAAGFRPIRTIDPWPGIGYCAVFERPR